MASMGSGKHSFIVLLFTIIYWNRVSSNAIEGTKPLFASGSAQTDESEEGSCVWFDECYTSPKGTKQNCVYNGTAQSLHDKEALRILRDICPDLVGDSPAPKLCCNAKQVHTLETNLGMPRQFFARCPSCFRNFAQLWCQSTCSPVQSKFINVTKVATDPETQKEYVDGIQYHIAEEFVEGLYKSCKNVQFPGTNQRALSFVCGMDAEKCTIDNWLRFLGDQSVNNLVPFNIDFIRYRGGDPITEEGKKPQNSAIVPCDQAPDDRSLACSCQDCERACVAVDPYPAPEEGECLIGNMECWTFISVSVFCAIACLLLVLELLRYLFNGARQSRFRDKTPLDSVKNDKGDVVTVTDKQGSTCETIGSWIEAKLEDVFNCWGRLCTRHPIVVFFFGLSVSVVCSGGLYFMEVTTDPVKLWSSPNSRARIEKDFFDKNFEPFYRTEQLIIIPKDKSTFVHSDGETGVTSTYGPVFRKEFLHEVLRLQESLGSLRAEYDGHSVTLQDICFQPLAPDKTGCAIMSVPNYFQNNHSLIDYEHLDEYEFPNSNYLSHLKSCFDGPTQVSDSTPGHLPCLAEFGAPVFPYVVLGGFNEKNYISATALVVTFVVVNHEDQEKNQMAKAWEAKFIEFMKSFRSPNMTVTFSTERSIQDEIDRESQSDVATILISYTVMFVYIAFALGQYKVYDNNLCYFLLKTKIMLGLAGVTIVLLSVTSSIGLYAYSGVPATLIIVEVVPFLVLAVGVDNIFILVQAYQRDRGRHQESVEERIGRICGEVIPSMMLSSVSECFCFFLGALSTMPAVKIFSLYAAMAIFFDFFLQITCFLALFTLDIRRQESGRLEMCCCVRLKSYKENETDSFLYAMVRDYYTPFLLWKPVRVIVFISFLAWLCASLAMINKIEIGLDQTLSMPEDSYVLLYFKSLTEFLSVGPPVYFVVKGTYNYSDPLKQNKICGSAGCDQNSLCGQLYTAAYWRNRSYIAHPVSSWLDDYYDWLRPGDPSCCRLYKGTNQFCPATVINDSCVSCDVERISSRPGPSSFDHYIDDYLADNPSMKCAKGGHAAYGQALRFESGQITASYFMTYHTVLKNSSDYINALVNARKISENITRTINEQSGGNVEVFPYSIFYVYYEQYLTLVRDAVVQLLLSTGAIFLVSTILMAMDPWSATMICLTLVMVLIDMMGMMYLWGIPFNAISLVNLVMSVGISVEFCAHTVRAFAMSVEPHRVDRAKEALSTVGSSVLSGITLTKFGGIVVLGFSHSQIFQVFYFRMYLGIVVYGALHGLVFLPVLLSFAGPPVNKQKLLRNQRRDILYSSHIQTSGESLARVDSYEQDLRSPMIHMDVGLNAKGSMEDGLVNVIKATNFAAIKHKDQLRKDGKTPYINHPIGVANLIVEIGKVTDPVILQAAMLHDTVEDTDATIDELRQQFGSKVAEIVAEVTDDMTLAKPEKHQLQVKNAPSLSYEARIVRLADKLYNLRDAERYKPPGWAPGYWEYYIKWSHQVVGAIRGTNAALEAELDAFYAKYSSLLS